MCASVSATSVQAKPSPVTQVPLPRPLLLPPSQPRCLLLPVATPLATTARQPRRVGLVVPSLVESLDGLWVGTPLPCLLSFPLLTSRCPAATLPFFLPDSSSVISDQYGNFQFSAKGAVHASRLDGKVPIFQENVEFAIPAEAASSSSPARGVADPEPVPIPDAPADSEEEGEEPAAKEARLIREAASVEHRLAHFPKNPACKVCTQARMYARKVARVRRDPLHDRGSLPPTTAFGERLAADIVVVFKESSKDERETTLLVVRDEFSGFLRSFPLARRTTENVVRALLQFIGKHAEDKPTIIFKSDNATELDSACQQMSWVPEPTGHTTPS